MSGHRKRQRLIGKFNPQRPSTVAYYLGPTMSGCQTFGRKFHRQICSNRICIKEMLWSER